MKWDSIFDHSFIAVASVLTLLYEGETVTRVLVIWKCCQKSSTNY